ncbi:unnamed protein product [Trifolium pratense]|uniref:Uncharacterized protein n=1 Tax=Trifolium pratense TaxID=57577 RepID=A0ACB0KM06_TRIPR|nr:unnamed protein product [Trifolium pratense]
MKSIGFSSPPSTKLLASSSTEHSISLTAPQLPSSHGGFSVNLLSLTELLSLSSFLHQISLDLSFSTRRRCSPPLAADGPHNATPVSLVLNITASFSVQFHEFGSILLLNINATPGTRYWCSSS